MSSERAWEVEGGHATFTVLLQPRPREIRGRTSSSSGLLEVEGGRTHCLSWSGGGGDSSPLYIK